MVYLGHSGAPVLVGVDGSRAAGAAVMWAAREAMLRRTALVIVHVYTERLAAGVGRWSDRAWGHDLLVRYAADAARAEPALPVGTQLVRGEPGAELHRLTATAAVLALGVDHARPESGAAPVAERVAAHPLCPVVLVPDPGSPAAAGIVVLAGWDDSVLCPHHLVVAAGEAVLRGLPLRVVVPARARDQWAAARTSLASVGHALIPLDLHHVEEEVADAMVARASEAELMVVAAGQWGLLRSVSRRRSATPLDGQLSRAVMVVRHRSDVVPDAVVGTAPEFATHVDKPWLPADGEDW